MNENDLSVAASCFQHSMLLVTKNSVSFHKSNENTISKQNDYAHTNNDGVLSIDCTEETQCCISSANNEKITFDIVMVKEKYRFHVLLNKS